MNLREANLPVEGVDDRFPDGYVVAETGGSVAAVRVHGQETRTERERTGSVKVYLLMK